MQGLWLMKDTQGPFQTKAGISLFSPRILKQEQIQGTLPIHVFEVGVLNLGKVPRGEVLLHPLRPARGRERHGEERLLHRTPSGKVERGECWFWKVPR